MKRIYSICLCLLLVACSTQADVSTEPVPTPRVSQFYDRINPDLLSASLTLGRHFLLANQKPEGNFQYQYNFVTKQYSNDDNQVRQTGALWGVATIHHHQPSRDTELALRKGIQFFYDHSEETRDGRLYIAYPGVSTGKTGTVALMALSLIDFLRADYPLADRAEYEAMLSKYLAFLATMHKDNGQFYASYDLDDGVGFGGSSPYFDGETLLALVKAANYLGYDEYKDIILEAAEKTYQANVVEALAEHPDSDTTKGFYQWSSMAFYELFVSGWEDTEKYADRAIDLAYWMIDVHETLRRNRNTAYAYEGLTSAWELARLTENTEAMEKIGNVINIGMLKLTSWQVGSPNQNKYILDNADPQDTLALGGIMNHRREPQLRIDVCQHQMHAVILTQRYVFGS